MFFCFSSRRRHTRSKRDWSSDVCSSDLIDGVYDASETKLAQEEARYEAMSEKQIAREIRALEKKMLEHAKNLEFEEAAKARDQLGELKKRVFGVALASE